MNEQENVQHEINKEEKSKYSEQINVVVTKPKEDSSLATASMILGIISLTPFSLLGFGVPTILAIIFGIVSLAQKRGKSKAKAGLICGSISLVIFLALFSLIVIASNFEEETQNDFNYTEDFYYTTEKETEDILKNQVDVQFGEFQVIEGEYSNDTKLVVTVKNKSDEKKSFYITVEAVDSEGYRLDTDTIYARDLQPGQGQKFEIFTFVTDSECENLKKATFRVLDVSKY